MKITRRQLRRIIKEEMKRTLWEAKTQQTVRGEEPVLNVFGQPVPSTVWEKQAGDREKAAAAAEAAGISGTADQYRQQIKDAVDEMQSEDELQAVLMALPTWALESQ